MKINLAQKLIVLAPNRQYLRDEAKNYGLTGDEAMFILVTNAAELYAVINSELPRDTPWCSITSPRTNLNITPENQAGVNWAGLVLPGTENDASLHPFNYFGAQVTFAAALRMETDERAIHPSRLRG